MLKSVKNYTSNLGSYELQFICLNFIVSFFADIVLNDLSKLERNSFFYSHIFEALQPYFREKSILVAGSYAGLTIVIALFILMFLSKIVLGFTVPTTSKELFTFIFIAFVLGYFLDIAIDKMNIFGDTLQPFYRIAGSGFWGGMAFVVSIVVSWFVWKFVLPYFCIE